MVSPTRVAFVTADSNTWIYINFFVDFCFFVDMLVIFNTALEDEEYNIIQDRKVISSHYLQGWFLVDIISIIPFDFILD